MDNSISDEKLTFDEVEKLVKKLNFNKLKMSSENKAIYAYGERGSKKEVFLLYMTIK